MTELKQKGKIKTFSQVLRVLYRGSLSFHDRIFYMRTSLIQYIGILLTPVMHRIFEIDNLYLQSTPLLIIWQTKLHEMITITIGIFKSILKNIPN